MRSRGVTCVALLVSNGRVCLLAVHACSFSGGTSWHAAGHLRVPQRSGEPGYHRRPVFGVWILPSSSRANMLRARGLRVWVRSVVSSQR